MSLSRVRGLRAQAPNNPRAPLVLACGSTALLDLSGDWSKLAVLTNLSGTNLDAEGARRVSGMDATNQTLSNPYPDKPALLVSTKKAGEASEVCHGDVGLRRLSANLRKITFQSDLI